MFDLWKSHGKNTTCISEKKGKIVEPRTYLTVPDTLTEPCSYLTR